MTAERAKATRYGFLLREPVENLTRMIVEAQNVLAIRLGTTPRAVAEHAFKTAPDGAEWAMLHESLQPFVDEADRRPS